MHHHKLYHHEKQIVKEIEFINLSTAVLFFCMKCIGRRVESIKNILNGVWQQRRFVVSLNYFCTVECLRDEKAANVLKRTIENESTRSEVSSDFYYNSVEC
jgi:hypothetical protein